MVVMMGDFRRIAGLVVCAASLAACASGDSYQVEAMQASDKGDLKAATSLAQKEVDKYSATDQCSSATNLNCGTLALAYSSLAEYQIRSGDAAAGERSFDRAKGALQRVPKDNMPSATGMVYRDVSEAFWKAGDKRRAIAVFKEGTTRGADEWLYTSSAAKAVAAQEGTAARPAAAPGAPLPASADADTLVKPILVNDPAVNDPMKGRPPSSAEPAPVRRGTPVEPATPLAPSPLTPTPLQRSR